MKTTRTACVGHSSFGIRHSALSLLLLAAAPAAAAPYGVGSNLNGHLGDGTTTNRTVFTAVDAGGVLVGKTLVAVSTSAAGLTYRVQFSATLGLWVDSLVAPAVLADDGTNQIVSVPYPALVAGLPPQFFRICVTITP